MAKDVIGMPLLGELLKSVILDIPALVAENDGALGRKLGRRNGGHPDPLAAEEFRLVIELPPYRVSFPGANHPHRRLYLRPGSQVGNIPPFTLSTAIATQLRRLLGKQRRRVHIQVPAFLLQYHQRMFAVRQQEVEKGSHRIKRIGQYQVERPRVARQNACEQPEGGLDFVFAGTLGFLIQE